MAELSPPHPGLAARTRRSARLSLSPDRADALMATVAIASVALTAIAVVAGWL